MGMNIAFSGLQSVDPDGEIVDYVWDFGDGETGYYSTAIHAYDQEGEYVVQLTVTDDLCGTDTATKTITAVTSQDPQPPAITTDETSFAVDQGQMLSVPLNVTDADTPLDDLSVTAQGTGAAGAYVRYGAGYIFEWQPSGDISGSFAIDLNVTDPEGNSDSRQIAVQVDTVENPGTVQWKIEEVGSLPVGNDAFGLDLNSGYAYLSTASTKKLFTVNISNPAAPAKIAEADTFGIAENLDFESNRIYVAAYADGIQVFSGGSNPSRYGEYDPGSQQFITVTAAGTTVFGMDSSGTMWVVNAANASAPSLYKNIAGVGDSGGYNQMATWNGLGYLYVGTTGGVAVVNYQNPASAQVVGTPISGSVSSVYIPPNQNLLYVGVDSDVKLYDISNRTSPSLIASGPVGKYGPVLVTADSNGLIMANDRIRYQYIFLLEVAGSDIVERTTYQVDTRVHSMKAQGGYLYAEYDDTFHVFSYGSALNHAPIAYNQSLSASLGQTANITMTGYDQDGNPLAYSIVPDSAYNGSLAGTPPTVAFGPFSTVGQAFFQFTVNDGYTDSAAGTIAVQVTDPDDPPQFDAPLPASSFNMNEGEFLSFEIHASDPDFGDRVNVTVAPLPTGATFENGVFAWVPESGQSQGSPYSLAFTATDLSGDTATHQVEITVNRTNAPPVIAAFSASPGSGKPPLTVNFTVDASDSDGTVASVQIAYGDGEQGTDMQHVYQSSGDFNATVTVTDNEGGQSTDQADIAVQPLQPGQLQFSASDYATSENASVFSVEILRTGGADGAVSVLCSSSDNTATAGSDYTAVSQTLNWAGGDGAPKTCLISIANDFREEGNETLNLSLSGATGGATVGAASNAVVSIEDDDVMGIQLDRSTLTVPEGATATFNVSLTAQPTAEMAVNINRTDGDADLGVQEGDVLTFSQATWNQEQTVVLYAAEDDDAECGEATIQTTSNGLETRSLTISENDNDSLEFETDFSEVDIMEGETQLLNARLTALPASSVTVTASNHIGDQDIKILSEKQLTFTAEDWDVYQSIVLESEPDMDLLDGVATIRLVSDGIPDADITVYEREKCTLENGSINLSNIVKLIQIQVGMDAVDFCATDISKDGNIGTEEIIYHFQVLAGQRK